MKRSILILSLLIGFMADSRCQDLNTATGNPNTEQADPDSILFFKKIQAYVDSLKELHGENIFNYLHQIKYDRLLNRLSLNDQLWDIKKIKSQFIRGDLLQPIGWVSDFEQLLTGKQVWILDSILSNHEKQTGDEVVLVTIDSSLCDPLNIDSLVIKVINNWDIGKTGINNGILITVSRSLRFINVQPGIGISNRLTDDEINSILSLKMAPELRRGNYYEGMRAGILALTTRLREKKPAVVD
jgi:uncharacterized protein